MGYSIIYPPHEPSEVPDSRAHIVHLIETMTQEAQGIPAVQHLAPRHTKPGTLDLTAATMFVKAAKKHALICDHARKLKKLIAYCHTRINLGAALKIFFVPCIHFTQCGPNPKT